MNRKTERNSEYTGSVHGAFGSGQKRASTRYLRLPCLERFLARGIGDGNTCEKCSEGGFMEDCSNSYHNSLGVRIHGKSSYKWGSRINGTIF